MEKSGLQKNYFEIPCWPSEFTPLRIPIECGLKSQILKPTFKNDGEKWSRFFFYFEILLAPSELLLPTAKKSAQKG